MTQKSKVSVIIPAYNEEEGLPKVIEEIPSAVDEIIVVDDGSSDKTYEVAKKYDVKVLKHEKNMGKVAAIRTGLKNATGDIIVLTDADYTYPAKYIREIVKRLEEGSDLVIGSRFSNKTAKMPKLNRIGNRILSSIASYVSGTKITDGQSGFRGFRKDFLEDLEVSASGLEFESEMTVKAAKLGYKVTEVPTEYRERTGKSKLNPFIDGYKMFFSIFSILYKETSFLAKAILFPAILFGLSGMIFGGISLNEFLIYGKPRHIYYPSLTVLFILLGFQLFSLGLIVDNIDKKMDRIYERLSREKKI